MLTLGAEFLALLCSGQKLFWLLEVVFFSWLSQMRAWCFIYTEGLQQPGSSRVNLSLTLFLLTGFKCSDQQTCFASLSYQHSSALTAIPPKEMLFHPCLYDCSSWLGGG